MAGSSRLPLLATGFLTLGSLGCGDAEPPFRAGTWDSAGVRIVQRIAGGWADGRPWMVRPEPGVVIEGNGPGAAGPLFRVAGALRLDDGRIVVADGGTPALRFLDAGGRPLFGVGGPGEGPGEFRATDGISRYPGDSIAVFDRSLLRVSIFDREGRFGRSFETPAAAAASTVELAGAMADGSVLLTAVSWRESRAPARAPGSVLRWHREGDGPDSVAPFPGPEMYWRSRPGFPPGPRMRPHGPATSVLVDSARVHVAPADDFEIRTYDPGGRLVRIFRQRHAPEPVTAELRERYARAWIEGAPNARVRTIREQEHRRGNLEFPEHLPAHAKVLLDREGFLWVEEYSAADTGERSFRIIAPEVEPLGTVTLPGSLEPLDIGADYVLGLARDSLGVERIRLHELVRSTPDNRHP